MNTMEMIKGVLFAIIGILVVVSLAIPIFNGLQGNMAEPTTIDNELRYEAYGTYYDNDTVLVIDGSTATTGTGVTYSVNGVTVSSPHVRSVIFVSDNMVIENNSTDGHMGFYSYTDMDGVSRYNIGTSLGQIMTITFDASEKTLTVTSTANGWTDIICNATYVFTLSTSENAKYGWYNSANKYAEFYWSDGEFKNRTSAVFKSQRFSLTLGEDTVSGYITWDKYNVTVWYDRSTYNYDITAEIVWNGNQVLAPDTLDVYVGGIPTFTVTSDTGDKVENITIERSYGLITAHGKSTDTVMNVLVGIIPLLLVVGLLVSIVGIIAFYTKYR